MQFFRKRKKKGGHLGFQITPKRNNTSEPLRVTFMTSLMTSNVKHKMYWEI
jgi:hypothetical protein